MSDSKPRALSQFFNILAGVFIACQILLSKNLVAGAWVHPPWKSYSQISLGYFQTDEIFNRNGDSIPNRIFLNPQNIFGGFSPSTFKLYSADMYVEYGLPFDTEIVLSFPLYLISEQDSGIGTFRSQGIGDLEVGMKYKWLDKPWLVSAIEFALGVPTADSKSKASVAGQFDQIISLGDGEWDQAIKMIFSHSFFPFMAYVSADIGYRFRHFDRGDNDLPWRFELGYDWAFERKWFSNFYPTLAFNGVQSLGTLSAQDALVIGSQATASGAAPNQEFFQIQPGLSFKIYGPFIWVNNFSYTIVGKNTGAGWSIRSGLALNFD